MTSEYWRTVWEVCEQARQLPREQQAAFVRANAPDADIAEDVLLLLAEPEESVLPSWHSEPRSESSSGGTAVRSSRTYSGFRIGRYTVGDPIGRGASGEVYVAHDTELQRSVAIKFLRFGLPEFHWRADWFLREARAASALNHPNIITVYEVIQSEAGLAIVMELVDGEALRSYRDSPAPVHFVTRCGAQVARALVAAHNSGIIHRDIKPENIMVRSDGLIKVLDFGLAQSRTGGDDELSSHTPAGTLRYMSPEQFSLQPLTAASDIFALGIVLYELLTGQHPFPAVSRASARASESRRPNPVTKWRDGIPRSLESLILEMLSHGPESRPGAAEVAVRLEELAGSVRKPRHWFWPAAVLAVVALAFATVWMRKQGGETSAISLLAPMPLTSTQGFNSWPDISPDGSTVVYGWGQSPDAYTHLFLKGFDQDNGVVLVEAEPGTRIGHPRWSPDGQRIYYKKNSSRGYTDSIWSVASDGSDARRVIDLLAAELSSGLDCSPDGKRIIYGDLIAGKMPFGVFSLDLATETKTLLTSPPGGWGDWEPRFSPDGLRIAFKRVNSPGDDELFIMPATGGKARRIPLPKLSIYGHAWLPEGGLLISAQLGSTIHGLWTVPSDGAGKPGVVFESGLDATMPAVSREQVVWVNQTNDYNIYSVPVAGSQPVRRIASPVLDSLPAPAADGRLAFVSQRSGSPEVWVTGPDTATAFRITNLRGALGRPSWSSDGHSIIFSVRRYGVTKIYRVDCTPGTLSCRAPELLGDGANPTWSADGRSIYYSPDGKDEIWRRVLSGGPPAYIAPGIEALTSRDRNWLYITRPRSAERFFRIPLNQDGSSRGPEQLVRGNEANGAGRQHWTLAGDEIIFSDVDIDTKFSGLKAYHTVTGRLRTVVEAAATESPAASPDGKTVWFAKIDSSGGTLMVAKRRTR